MTPTENSNLTDADLQVVAAKHHLAGRGQRCDGCRHSFPCPTWRITAELIRTRAERTTNIDAETLHANAEWLAIELIRTRQQVRDASTQTETQRLVDYANAQGYVARGCCCTTNHAQVITDYQSQEHTS